MESLPSYVTINPDGSASYVVQPGDNLSSISKYFSNEAGNYGIIASDNNIANPNIIVEGQVLTINKNIVANEKLVSYVKQLNESNTYSTTSSKTSASISSTSGEGLNIDIEAVKSLLKNELNQDFKNLHNHLSELISHLDELQNVFYGPNNSDCTLIYKELSKIIGNDVEKTGLVGDIVAAHEWCESVDKYIQDFERINNTGDI